MHLYHNLPDHPKLLHNEWRTVVQGVENPKVAALNSWLQTKKKHILFMLAICLYTWIGRNLLIRPTDAIIIAMNN